jgi:hypothetical protein
MCLDARVDDAVRRMPGKGHWRELKKLWIITSLVNY